MTTLFLLVIFSWPTALWPSTILQQTPSRDQQTKLPPKAEEKREDKTDAEVKISALQQRSIDTILQAGDEAASLDDRRYAVLIQAVAADALWKHDQDHARQFFQRAFEQALKYYRDGKGDEQEQMASGLSMSRPDLRLEVIRLANRHDAQLGRQFIDQYVVEKRRQQEERRNQSGQQRSYDAAFGTVDEAGQDLLHISEQLLEVDKSKAVELAQRAFSKGIPQAAGYLFTQLAERDRASADQFYLMALERLRQDNFPIPGQLLLLSAYPFGDSNVWVTGGDGVNSYSFQVPKNFTVDEGLVQQFISTAFGVLTQTIESDLQQFPDAASRIGAALFAARLLEPKVARFRPTLLANWHVVTNRLFALTSDYARADIEKTISGIKVRQEADSPVGAEDRIKALLDRAQNTSDFTKRDDLYQQAALLADMKGETERALEIANKIASLEPRRKTRSWICFEAAKRAIDKQRFDDARRLALEVDATDQRAYLFYEIARIALKENNRGYAVDLLTEAERRATTADNTPEKIRALVGIASLYASFDSLRGFEVVAEAVRTANRLPNYGPAQARLVRGIETPSGRGLNISVDNFEGFDLGKTLASLARADFERSILLAASLENKPLKLLTVVSIAASVFEIKPPPAAAKGSH